MENGYHIYDFKGEALREESIDKFKQFQWRPRPPTLLTKEEQKQVRKNLREYSRVFDQDDADRGASADLAVVEARRQVLQEWYAWRAEVEEEIAEERAALALPQNPHALLEAKTKEIAANGVDKDQVIEEIVEDVLEESEEVLG
jgi:translation initiation factor 3 subunit B